MLLESRATASSSSSRSSARIVQVVAALLALMIATAAPSFSQQSQGQKQGQQEKRTSPPGGGTVVPMGTLSCNPAIGCTAGNPPSIAFGPLPNGGNTVYTADPFTITITWCDDGGLNSGSRSVKLNGTSLTSTYTGLPMDSYCWAKAQSTATITPQVGSNTIQASINDNFAQPATSYRSFTYDPHQIDITPHSGSVAAPVSASFTQPFVIDGITSSPGTYNISVIAPASLTGCSADSSQVHATSGTTTVKVTCQTGALGSSGTLRLRAASTTRPLDVDTGSVTVTASLNGFAANVSSPSSSKYREDPALCLAGCFDASFAQSTVPYFSMGAARNVTFVYHGDRVAVRPFIYADVSLVPGRAAPSEYWLQASVNYGGGFANVTFLNGESTLHFSGSGTVSFPPFSGHGV